MKNLLLAILFTVGAGVLYAQDFQGYWVGIITEGSQQYKFEINIYDGKRSDPAVHGRCRPCKRLRGDIIDHREEDKIIDFFGIINVDESVNMIDSKFAYKEKFEGEIRTRYQVNIEIKGGVPWLVGYYQDYNSKGRKVKQGKIYLKREKPVDSKA